MTRCHIQGHKADAGAAQNTAEPANEPPYPEASARLRGFPADRGQGFARTRAAPGRLSSRETGSLALRRIGRAPSGALLALLHALACGVLPLAQLPQLRVQVVELRVAEGRWRRRLRLGAEDAGS